MTLSGTNLGKVYDFTLDLNNGYLAKLYVRPVSLLSLAKDHIIDFSQIISIEKNKIVVEDLSVKSTSAIKVDAPEPL